MTAATTTANSQLHPVFRAALSAFVHSDALAIQRAAYVKALQRHDWSHEFSDDGAVARRGRESLAQLRMVQRELDPEFFIWNTYAPAQCRDGAVYA